MKISQEDQVFLEELSHKINTQDKRATSYVMFMIYDKKQVWRGNEGEERERRDMDSIDTDDLCESCQKLYENDDDLPEDCDDCSENCFYTFDWELQPQDEYGVFFTAEACELAIAQNGHHFHEPKSFGISAYHSPEMRRIMEIISKLTSEKEGSELK